MSKKYEAQALGKIARVQSLHSGEAVVDRSFELPTGIYLATITGYLGFLAIMAIGFQSPEMVIPMAVFVVYIAMAFGVPAAWTRMNPSHGGKAMTAATFMRSGIETATGRVLSKDAILQVLLLPALVFGWGIVVVSIAALV